MEVHHGDDLNDPILDPIDQAVREFWNPALLISLGLVGIHVWMRPNLMNSILDSIDKSSPEALPLGLIVVNRLDDLQPGIRMEMKRYHRKRSLASFKTRSPGVKAVLPLSISLHLRRISAFHS